jgi:integrase/recombinase XerD
MEHLTREELLDVLALAKQHRERDHVMLLVTFWHGLRASETCGLTSRNFKDGYLTVQRLKGSMKTKQPLVSDENGLLDEKSAVTAWLAKNEGRLFPVSRIQFYRLFRRYCKLAGIPAHKAHPHVLKHSIAMATIREAGIENVRQYLGHKSISSTGAYLKVDDETASLAILGAAKKR